MQKIPFLRPNLVELEDYKKYIKEIDEAGIYSNYGPLNNRFEKRILKEYFFEKGYVTTVNNATLGLIIAISQMKRPKGKYALMPSFTFSATPLAAQWCGLEPYFVDIDKEDWFMAEKQLTDVIRELGEEVAIVIPYATFGNYLECSFYQELQNSGIPVVIDAAPCFGTSYNGTYFGQDFSGAVVFSFHATKSFGIGEGGLIYSSNKNLIKNIKAATNFGYSGSRESILLGLNAKMPEQFAAIGLATLDVFQDKIRIREKLYEIYMEEITERGLIEQGWQVQKIRGRVPFQFFSILCPENNKSQDYMNRMSENHIAVATYFSPACHQQKQFKAFRNSDLSVTNNITKRILSLPFWEGMDRNIIKQIVTSLVDKK